MQMNIYIHKTHGEMKFFMATEKLFLFRSAPSGLSNAKGYLQELWGVWSLNRAR